MASAYRSLVKPRASKPMSSLVVEPCSITHVKALASLPLATAADGLRSARSGRRQHRSPCPLRPRPRRLCSGLHLSEEPLGAVKASSPKACRSCEPTLGPCGLGSGTAANEAPARRWHLARACRPWSPMRLTAPASRPPSRRVGPLQGHRQGSGGLRSPTDRDLRPPQRLNGGAAPLTRRPEARSSLSGPPESGPKAQLHLRPLAAHATELRTGAGQALSQAAGRKALPRGPQRLNDGLTYYPKAPKACKTPC